MTEQRLRNLTKGTVVADRVSIARSLMARFRGLMGRKSLENGNGLWLPGTNGIHMFFMNFPIDAVFLDKGWSVLAVAGRLKPWRTATRLRARAVLELAAGEAERVGVRVGERLEAVEA
jgi:uncharacterized membrane protein (UPF0127 family)